MEQYQNNPEENYHELNVDELLLKVLNQPSVPLRSPDNLTSINVTFRERSIIEWIMSKENLRTKREAMRFLFKTYLEMKKKNNN